MNKIIFPLQTNMQSASVADLQDTLLLLIEKEAIRLSDAERQELSNVLANERQESIFKDATAKLVSIFQEQRQLEPIGEVNEPTATALNALLRELGRLDPPIEPSYEVYRVEGKVVSRVSASVGGLRVVVVDKGVGGDQQLAETLTSERGTYQITFPATLVRQRNKTQPDLQARAFMGEQFLGASDVHYNASQQETLNVLLEDKASKVLNSEHEVLTSALSKQFAGNLRDLKETDEQRDITYLANKSGWDARAVALAALADKFTAQTLDANGALSISPAHFYALFRAGLPANEDTLFHTNAKTLESVWKQAAEQGVIPKTSLEQIPNLVQQFQSLSAKKLLVTPAIAGASSLTEMLNVSGLQQTQQEKFAELYTQHMTDMPSFWKAVGEDVTFGTTSDDRLKVASRLQVDGKLGFLTLNNAPLMQQLHSKAGESGLSDPLQLAQMGLHTAAPWSELLNDSIAIPEGIPGESLEVKRANFADYMAAQVRLSYPTAAVAQMVKSRVLPLTEAQDDLSEQVHTFLSEHQGKYEIGVQPVQQYLAQNNIQIADTTLHHVKRLERVYQITASDQAMIGLMKRNVDSTSHIVRYDKETFVQSFADDLGGADQATVTYDRSVQLHNVVLNLALSYISARTAPPIGVHSPASIIDPIPANAGDVIAYATLEDVFGSMDFCECKHCRSILSPAAYMVDLMLFLNSEDAVWKDYLKEWKLKHENAPYPFMDDKTWQAYQTQWNLNHPGDPLPNTELSPFDVLMSRRPDIQHLPLTCENTNTPLPYIDIVNETLEYFIANTKQQYSLEDFKGYDSSSISSEDMMASPQFVIDSAYDTLSKASFPISLPFHKSLETLRRYFNKFEVPLPLAMERLRKSDDLEDGVNPYGWRDILMEELGLAQSKYEILTSNATVPLWQMYGFPSGTADADVIDQIANCKRFTRRVGVSYEDLVAMLRTRLINPNRDLIPKLEMLGVEFSTLKALKDGTITDADFDAKLAALAVPPNPAEFLGDIKAWVKKPENFDRIMGLVTISLPLEIWKATTIYKLGDVVRPATAPPGTTLYLECTTAGTSATTGPILPVLVGQPPILDGTVKWTCRDDASSSSFENLAFRWSDPAKLTQNIEAVFFVRLLRFIRLWRKLGWTIEQTDAAICALYRTDLSPLAASDVDDVTKLDTGFLTLLPRLGIAARVMKALNLNVKRDLLPLLACWSDIGTFGQTALYRQMFLNRSMLEQDAIFADFGDGEFLQHAEVSYTHAQPTLETPITNAALGKISYNHTTKHLAYSGVLDAPARDALIAVPGVSPDFQQAIGGLYNAQRLAMHTEALRSAFNLSSDEFSAISTALGYDANTALTISTISEIYRRGWLARKLKLSVREFLLLTQLTGLDPFKLPDPTHPAILHLISLVQSLKDSSLKTSAALYLIWNQDLSGKSKPDAADITELARTLRAEFASTDEAFAVLEDPNGDIAKARMTLVYGQDTSDTFFALLDDALVVDVPYTHAADMLEEGITKPNPRIAYEKFRHLLSHKGLVTTAMQNALTSVVGVSASFKDAVKALFERSNDIRDSFFGRNKELEPIYNKVLALDTSAKFTVSYKQTEATLAANITDTDSRIKYDAIKKEISYSGLLTFARREILKGIPDTTPEFQLAVDALFTLSQLSRSVEVLNASQPLLVSRRKRQQALEKLSSAATVDLEFARALLDASNTPYPLYADAQPTQPALEDALSLDGKDDPNTKAGLAAQFFFRDTATGSVDETSSATKLNYDSNHPLPNAGSSISGIWTGHIEAPESGFYNFILEVDTDATVTLNLGGQNRTLVQNGKIRRNGDAIELKAGTLYKIEVKVEKVKTLLNLKWETPKRERELIPVRYLYSPLVLETFATTYIRFLKAVSLATGLGLTANELAFFATHSDYRIDATGKLDSTGQGWLNHLPRADNLHLTDPAEIALAKTLNATLLTPLLALLDFARIKTELSSSDESLLKVLIDPTVKTQTNESVLLTLTQWSETSLNDMITHFGGMIARLKSFEFFRCIYRAMALTQTMSISAKALIQATGNDPTSKTVSDLQLALRARYDPADWRDAIKPINDELRSLQRDALVTYILHHLKSHPESAHINTPDKLFEYFLMDVQMEPCMQTSRIRHALSSLQLFIERCLMNLEPRVSPLAINKKQWQWMKRYRVWEANRKVYLYPENWCEPELRDNKSPFFKEIESELLQSDITEDSAATALLNYLAKLEEVAKLEPCGIFHIPANPAQRTGEINHVVARTAGANRKYYYRKLEDTSWTPWEHIKLDIEDNPVLPVVWKERLFLFWLRILKQSAVDPNSTPVSPGPMDSGKERSLANVSLSDIKRSVKQDAKTSAQLTVQAVLCWSEYYNGKWQATKTSDVNKPTRLADFSLNEFDRAKLKLTADTKSGNGTPNWHRESWVFMV